MDYSGGRSNGCTSWSSFDAARIDAMVEGHPTTLYIYPEAGDIRGRARRGSRPLAGARWALFERVVPGRRSAHRCTGLDRPWSRSSRATGETTLPRRHDRHRSALASDTDPVLLRGPIVMLRVGVRDPITVGATRPRLTSPRLTRARPRRCAAPRSSRGSGKGERWIVGARSNR